ncbi:MAG: CHASE2 domain-containing protein, partial [Verrucomicrobiota bacterium]
MEKWNKKYGRSLAVRLTMALIGGGIALVIGRLNIGGDLERSFYDGRVRWDAGFRKPSAEIVVLAVDNASVLELEEEVGRWPWPRELLAALVNYCSEARVVAFDVFFSERQKKTVNRDDGLLAGEIEAHGRVVSAVVVEPSPMEPFEGVKEVSAAMGHINVFPDLDDGTVRSWRPWMEGEEGGRVPALALATLAVSEGLAGTRELTGLHGDEPVETQFLLKPFTNVHKTVSAMKVLSSYYVEDSGEAPEIPRSLFKDKFVFIGLTASGVASDFKLTSVNPALPGVYINALALDNLRHHGFYRRAPGWGGWALAVLTGLLFAVPYIERPRRMALLGAVWLMLFMAFAFLLCRLTSVMIPMAAPFLTGVTVSIALTLLYWYEERRRRSWLEHLEKAKQQYTDMLVHDMKNRMNSVTLGLHLLESRVDLEDEETVEVMGTVNRSSDQLLLEMNSLLDIRSMQEGKLQLRPESKPVRAVIEPLLKGLEAPAKVVGCRWHIEGEERLDEVVEMDEQMLGRLLENLGWNAMQHARTHADLTVGIERQNELVGLSVSNPGPVIPKEDAELLFDPFWSGDLGKKKKLGGGAGLGLAFCKLAAEAHGGHMEVTSPRPGREDGVKMNGYNSTKLWDTTFAVQAAMAAGAPQSAEGRAMISRAHDFIDQNQVREDVPAHERFWRHPSRGGWPFSDRPHGWPITD